MTMDTNIKEAFRQVATDQIIQDIDNKKIFAQKTSPEFTGVPKSPTAEKGKADKQIANCEFVSSAIDDFENKLKQACEELISEFDE